MATWIFTEKIINNEPIEVYNNGNMERDFTYIDDIVKGTLNVVDFCGKQSLKKEAQRGIDRLELW